MAASAVIEPLITATSSTTAFVSPIPLSEYIENDSDLKTQAIFSQEEKSVSARRRNQRPRRARYQFA
ncbi:MAG: hypothetical protein DMF73_17555 [Acidobacteria bacterium]|nr:MAG: hypothetical protein DMF73_17555 [Acidobacteriota bacterium]